MIGILEDGTGGFGDGVANPLLTSSFPLPFRGGLLATKLAVDKRSLGRLFFLTTGIRDPELGLSIRRPAATFS